MEGNKPDPVVLSPKDLNHPVLFVIDMINGFAKEGPLADPAIADLAPHIASLIDTLQCPTVFVADEHEWNASEFDAFPPHCLKETAESQVIDELKPYEAIRIPKNSTNTFFAPAFQDFLREKGDDFSDWILTGCCTDLCVMQFALSLRAWANQNNIPLRILIPENCVDTYQIDGVHEADAWNRMALDNMKMNGIQVVSAIQAESAGER